MALSRRRLAMRDRVKSARFEGLKSPPSAAKPRRGSPVATASNDARRPVWRQPNVDHVGS